ncbi:MAG: peroxiredoxin family protein, partial [Actinomycetota bacterium]|nr:peroxiredoxin family protein [Actinomycetota bacterium]
MDSAAPLLARGLRAPDFVLPRADGTATRFYAIAGGRPAVICLFDAGDSGQVEAVTALAAALGQGDGLDVSLHRVARPGASTDRGDELHNDASFDDAELLSDVDGKVHAAYRAGRGVTGYLLDPNLRVLDGWTDASPADAARAVRAAVAELPRQEASEITAQAPVLLIPDALDAGMCAELMSVWEQQGAVETGVESSAGGRRADTMAVDYKRRRDHTVTDQALSQRIASEVGRRIMPEIAKAFAFRASRFEGFKIGCYDATTGGFFRAHRDNL